MSRKIDIAPDEFYHIYNRGTDKRKIFLSDRDYERFTGLLYACNGDRPVDLKLQGSTLYDFLALNRGDTAIELCAYVLMPNHFHLLVRGRVKGDVSKFMQKLSTGYTMYFNTRQERSGSLFQGKFKASPIHRDTYLSYVIAYMHLNPVKLIESSWKETGIADRQRAEQFLREYRWSSYKDYLGEDRKETILLTKHALPEYWDNVRSFESFVTDWFDHGSQSNAAQPRQTIQNEPSLSLV